MRIPCLFLQVVMLASTSFAAPVVQTVRVSPDGKLLAACVSDRGKEGRLVVWDAVSLKPKFSRHDPIGFGQIAFSPDSQRMVVAPHKKEAEVVDASTGKAIGLLSGHTNHVGGVAYTPDGQQIVTAARDRIIRIFDAHTFALLDKIEETGIRAGDIAISPDGKTLAVADGGNNLFRLFDYHARREILVSEKMGSHVPEVKFSPDGKCVAACCWVGPTNVYHVAEPGIKASLDTYAHGVAFSPDSTWLAVLASRSAYLFEFGEATDKEVAVIQRLLSQFRSDDYQVRNAASESLKKAGRIATPFLNTALKSDDPEVRIRCRRIVEYLSKTDSAIELKMDAETRNGAFSRDGKRLFVGTEKGTVGVWDLKKKRLVTLLPTNDSKQ